MTLVYNSSYYLFICIISIISLLLIIYHFWKKIHKLQKDLAQQEINHTRIVNNMPIIYLQIKTIYDEQGTMYDFEYLYANNYFRNLFNKHELIGKKGSKVFPDNIDEILKHIHLAKSNSNQFECFTYYHEP